MEFACNVARCLYLALRITKMCSKSVFNKRWQYEVVWELCSSSSYVNPDKIYGQMFSLIRRTLGAFLPKMIEESRKLNALPGQLFQLSRWDFMLKKDLTVHLIEVGQ